MLNLRITDGKINVCPRPGHLRDVLFSHPEKGVTKRNVIPKANHAMTFKSAPSEIAPRVIADRSVTPIAAQMQEDFRRFRSRARRCETRR
jgi:hypothetical protein